MTSKLRPLEHVLSGSLKGQRDLEQMPLNELKKAARAWVGKEAGSMNKLLCLQATKRAMQDKRRCEEIVQTLPETQYAVLSIFKRYGGALSGSLLTAEINARGLAPKKEPARGHNYYPRPEDPVEELQERLFLWSYDRNRYYSSFERGYPDLEFPGCLADFIDPAAPLTWKPSSKKTDPPKIIDRRSGAETALELGEIALELERMGSWKTIQGGAMAKNARERLKKFLATAGKDPLAPPDPESFYYEILRGIGAIKMDFGEGAIDRFKIENIFKLSSFVQARLWVRAWLDSRLWQDGIGLVPDRDNDYDPVRIPPDDLRQGRRFLVWALCRVAHSPEEWLDLETFLKDLWVAGGEGAIDCSWYDYAWRPEIAMAKEKDKFPAGPQRSLAFWLDSDGIWVSHAIVSTLRHLGLVERGRAGAGGKTRYFFRLTSLGKVVFGAPEIIPMDAAPSAPFLVAQPNHEIVAYLDSANASNIWFLRRITQRSSGARGPIQTFVLNRESVYSALESGLTVESIHRFFKEAGKSGLPDNVAQSLTDWSRKRESLVIRTNVALAAFEAGHEPAISGDGASAAPRNLSGSKKIGERFFLLSSKAGDALLSQGSLFKVLDHAKEALRCWEMNEEGCLRVPDKDNSISRARLCSFAQQGGSDWRITAASVRKAKERGIKPDQIAQWLKQHLTHELAPIVEATLRNWGLKGEKVFLAEALLLQAAHPQVFKAILKSERFKPFLEGPISEQLFMVRPDTREQLEALLSEAGFSIDNAGQVSTLSLTEAGPK